MTQRRHASPFDITPKGWLSLLGRVWLRQLRDHVGLIAAGCAFFGMLAIFPGLFAMMAVAGLLIDPAALVVPLREIGQILPAQAAEIVIEQAQQVAGSTGSQLGLTAALGLGVAFYSSSRGMASLIEGLNVAFHKRETRSLFKLIPYTFLLTLMAMLGALAGVSAVALLPEVTDHLLVGHWAQDAARVLRWPLILVLVDIALALLYRFGPAHPPRRWRWITPGSTVACLVWLAGTLAFAWYVRTTSAYSATFGTFAGMIVLLMFLWLTAYIVLLGATLDSEIEGQAKDDPEPESGSPSGPAEKPEVPDGTRPTQE
ncbi:YihY/virulence factor BrkB family protein [Pseudoroseicyclus aestuarii]|uniref:Membrane protein n=1 Tax=Pseudoroseicyclus aestuarii TaxID=1795041 RepID=A0A318T5U8_9RHOB|nr:YihY/virulence factor BrkB family protein [Pseudoroseicyclus aestuarii]PYE85774.1 membrane protein [Pseudoroseicyclus aestuarii]